MTTQAPIPRLPGRPFAGNLAEFRHDRLRLLGRVHAACGDVAELRMGPMRVFAVTAPALAEAILVDHAADFRKSRGLAIARVLVGDGLLTSGHDVHRRQRKLVAPAFRHGRIAGYADAMVRRAEAARRTWPDGAVVDVSEEMMRLTLAIVAETLFGADVDRDADAVGEALTVALRYVSDAVSRFVNLPLAVPTPRNRRMRRAIARLDEIVYRIVAERRAARDGGVDDRGDVLSILLAARDEDDGRGMTDVQLRDEVMTLFLAGHETTANALAWTWWLLVRHPEAGERLRAEVDTVLRGRPPTVADLPALPFTLQVLKESMRLYPPAYVVGREAERDVDLPGLRVPRGRILLLNVFGIQRRPDLFEEPERFLPERFEPERERHLPRFAYFPFGGGPRVCIGNHFATMEGHLLLATLAQRVVFEPAGSLDVEPEPLVTLRPKGGIRLRVRHRDQAASAA